jgi:hypothetical protein
MRDEHKVKEYSKLYNKNENKLSLYYINWQGI